MTVLQELYSRMISAMNVEGLKIPITAVKIYKNTDNIPAEVLETFTNDVSLTSCQAYKQAYLGDSVLITSENIGCIAAAITFGLVDKNSHDPLTGSRTYTDIMKNQSGHGDTFLPPSPNDFTEGNVYACKEAAKSDFALFGKEDSGRFATRKIAKKAMDDMLAIQPADTKGVFFFSVDFEEIDVIPDVVIMDVRPVELTRLIQAYQFNTGERVTASMGSVRAVNSDLIIRPYLTNQINISPYCVGARLIAQMDANKLGIGMPFEIIKTIVKGMEDSQTGYPFQHYPGAKQTEI